MSGGVTPAKIKELRDRTGVGMGKCKVALTEAEGDIEKAIDILRKQGLASAAKKEDRAAEEGAIFFAEAEDCVAIVEVNAETDFVVKNERFQEFAKAVAEEVASSQPESLEALMEKKCSKDPSMTIDELRGTVVQAIGENIQIKRFLVLSKSDNRSVGIYSHMGGRLVTAVEIKGADDVADLAKDIAMHVAAASPDFLKPELVPADVIEREKSIAREQLKGKPENIMDKILDGKVNAFYDQHCLLHQKFIRDDSLTISELVKKRAEEKGKDLEVANFTRWSVGAA